MRTRAGGVTGPDQAPPDTSHSARAGCALRRDPRPPGATRRPGGVDASCAVTATASTPSCCGSRQPRRRRGRAQGTFISAYRGSRASAAGRASRPGSTASPPTAPSTSSAGARPPPRSTPRRRRRWPRTPTSYEQAALRRASGRPLLRLPEGFRVAVVLSDVDGLAHGDVGGARRPRGHHEVARVPCAGTARLDAAGTDEPGRRPMTDITTRPTTPTSTPEEARARAGPAGRARRGACAGSRRPRASMPPWSVSSPRELASARRRRRWRRRSWVGFAIPAPPPWCWWPSWSRPRR